MLSLEENLKQCEQLHGHMCAGQLLGVRMAMLGCQLIGIEDPTGKDRKKILVWVEIDRCMTDAVSAVTGVRLGRRSLKYVDYGKVAATFLNSESNKAVRVVALESSRALADNRYPEITDKRERQFKAYSLASDEELFMVEKVSVAISAMDLPGRPRSRVVCSSCAEGINDGRQIMTSTGQFLCRPCAGSAYYSRMCPGQPEQESCI